MDPVIGGPFLSLLTGVVLAARSKSDPRKLAIAARLRQETTLSIKQIAETLASWKAHGSKNHLHKSLNPAPRLTSELQRGL